MAPSNLAPSICAPANVAPERSAALPIGTRRSKLLGNLLLARGIETVVLERTTRAQVQTRARAGELRFGGTVTDVDPHTGSVRYRDEHGDGEISGRYVAGCDGSNGATRHAVPTVRHTRGLGIS